MISGFIYTIISAASFGMLAIFGKLAFKAGFLTEELLMYRFIFASIFFVIFFLIKDRSLFKISLKDFFKAFFAGAILYFIQAYAFIKALEFIAASTAALILYVYPLSVTILSMIFFKTKINRSMFLSLFLIMCGCCFIFYDAFSRNMSINGIFYAVLAMLTFSFYLIFIQKSLKNIKPITFSFYVILSTAFSFSLFSNPLNITSLTTEKFTIAMMTGLIPTFIAVTLLYIAVEKIGSVYASIFSTVEPIVTVTASYLILNENIVFIQIVGAIFILGGIILPNYTLLIKK